MGNAMSFGSRNISDARIMRVHKETVRYLGLIISTKGISMVEDRIEIVKN